MSSFLKMEILARVSGFDIDNDKKYIQIQNISFKGEKIVKNTIKIHKHYTKEQLEQLVGKTIKVVEPEEYTKGFKTFYAGKDIKKVDIDIDFKVNKKLEMKVDNLIESKDSKNEKRTHTILQSIIQNGTRADLFNIKIKDIKKELLQDLKGKKVLVENVEVVKVKDAGTFYSSIQKPKVIA
jgi:ribosomal protein S7